MRFHDREEAAQYLVERLHAYRDQNPLVLAIPRGAIVMGRIIADELKGELDVVLVRKLRAPGHPELAIGSIDEAGNAVLTDYGERLHIPESYLDGEKRLQLETLKRRRIAYTRAHEPANPIGRVVIVVDDGIATGATMLAALESIRQRKPRKLIAAAAVAPPENVERVRAVADEVVCLVTPADFYAVGQFFDDFREVTDDEVVALLKTKKPRVSTPDPPVSIRVEGVELHGDLSVPSDPLGIVIFAHGSGSSRLSPRNRHVAEVLQRHGMGTLLFDLLTEQEDRVYENRFDIERLGRRLAAVTSWLAARPEAKALPIAYFGASTGAAAALVAAARPDTRVACVVSRGGRPDLAMEAATHVSVPTLLIVGEYDSIVLDFNRRAFQVLKGVKEILVIPGASHLFEEPGTLDEAALKAAEWFRTHLEAPRLLASTHTSRAGGHGP